MKKIILSILLSGLFTIMSLAQESGYFGLWESGHAEQEIVVYQSFNEWISKSQSHIDAGFVPIDFDVIKVNRWSENYQVIWEKKEDNTFYWFAFFAFEEFMDKDSDLVNNEGLRLIDFEVIYANNQVYYFGIWQPGTGGQRLLLQDNLDFWYGWKNQFEEVENLGLTDFEKFDVNGFEFYFGVFREKAGQVRDTMVSNLEDWRNLNQELVQEQGLQLVEFETYESGGQTMYFGSWQELNKNQQIALTNNMEDWNNIHNRFVQNEDFKLVSFEMTDAENVNPLLPYSRVITDDDLIGGREYNWSKDTIYILEGNVKLEFEGVLNIEAGTNIRAKKDACLIIEYGKINAVGTEQNPIVFTTIENPPVSSSSPTSFYNQWAGIIIEGQSGLNSGVLKYVSIRHAGLGKADEIGAGITLWTVDQSTTIDYVEVFASGGDGFRLYGGAVNISHASVAFVGDDAFDWDYGWIGNGIYWLAYEADSDYFRLYYPNLSDGSYAIEGKSNINDLRELYNLSNPKIYNVSFVGTGCGISDFSIAGFDGAIHLRDGSAGTIANSSFTEFPRFGIKIEDIEGELDSRQQMEDGNVIIASNIWWNINNLFNPVDNLAGIIEIADNAEDTNAVFLQVHLANNKNKIEGPGLSANAVGARNCFALDPRFSIPNDYNNIVNLNYPANDFFATIPENNLKGGFVNNEVWIKNWTAIDHYGNIGEEANGVFYYKDKVFETIDTLQIACEELINFQDSLGFGFPCLPNIILTGASARMGNKRRRPGPRNKNLIAFIEEWNYIDQEPGCGAFRELSLIIEVIDTTAPIIYLIPDENGILSAFVEDCDEAYLSIERDTFFNDLRERCVSHQFAAVDYSENASYLEVIEKLDGEVTKWFVDWDGDGFGNQQLSILMVGPIEGFVQDSTDCNDLDANAYPTDEPIWALPEEVDGNCEDGIDYDICQKAQLIKVDSFCNEITNIDFRGVSSSIFLPRDEGCIVANNYRDVWIKFEVPASREVFLSVGNTSSYGKNYTIELFKGDCDNLLFLSCINLADGIGIKPTSS